ncbi:MAG: hypothetical protein ACPG5U_07340 [Planktomarina sp.]
MWIQLFEEEVENLLNDTSWSYGSASQTFHKSGITEYNAGRPSIGNWRAYVGGYCSEWPPNAGWDCYDLFLDVDSGAIKFVSEGGDETIGTPVN